MALKKTQWELLIRSLQKEAFAIVLGPKGDGLADGTIMDCDYAVRIPMSHGWQVLNVAAA